MPTDATPTGYTDLALFFVELRGKGVSLSTFDLDVLESWETSGLEVPFLAKVMIDMNEECLKKNKPFPQTLAPVARRVHKILLTMREF